LPSLAYTDFKRLAAYYDFISVGRTRIADGLCEVIRVVARDGTRYSYIVWLDAETKLPMRVDLLDRDGETLEQFRVVSFNVGDKVSSSMETWRKQACRRSCRCRKGAIKPTLTGRRPGCRRAFPKSPAASVVCRPLMVRLSPALYSDGLFSFSINVNRATANSSDQLLRTGRRTVSTTVRDNAEITVVGELPPQTAKRISDSIKFRAVQ
jgi:sigma-E factor negative regulatory protein RseB